MMHRKPNVVPYLVFFKDKDGEVSTRAALVTLKRGTPARVKTRVRRIASRKGWKEEILVVVPSVDEIIELRIDGPLGQHYQDVIKDTLEKEERVATSDSFFHQDETRSAQ